MTETNAVVTGEPLRMMCVHAHPDDEASKGAAAMARYVDEGVHVTVVTCTGGERGDILNPQLAGRTDLLESMPQVRRDEMAASAAVLGVDHVWLGFVDSGLPEGDPLPPLPEGCFASLDPDEAAVPLVRLLRDERPHVLTTYDPQGGYPHPDHIMCHTVSMAAYTLAADPGFRPDLGDAWRVPKVYYVHGFTTERLVALTEAMSEAGLTSPYVEWIAHRDADDPEPNLVTTRVECAAYFPRRDAALRAHATQVDPDGLFFAVPRDIETRVWPWEEFELAFSQVPTSLPETDLFAGLR